jgi:hypothetical protein
METVRPVGENGLDESGRLRADRARPGDDPRGRPLEVALMSLLSISERTSLES